MEEARLFKIRDPLHETSTAVYTRQDAINRALLVSNVQYDFTLALREGQDYLGSAIINFTLLQKPSSKYYCVNPENVSQWDILLPKLFRAGNRKDYFKWCRITRTSLPRSQSQLEHWWVPRAAESRKWSYNRVLPKIQHKPCWSALIHRPKDICKKKINHYLCRTNIFTPCWSLTVSRSSRFSTSRIWKQAWSFK